ncbi:omptin family outer membrane protease [Kosakonia sp.]
MPYPGIAVQYRINDVEINALLKFSDWFPTKTIPLPLVCNIVSKSALRI